jgi:hypothetical protein
MNARAWEKLLGEILRRFRQSEIEPLCARVAGIEQRQAIEERVARLEQRAGADGVEAKMASGAPVTEREWLAFVARMQQRDPGTWRPEHASWRGGS